MRLVHSRPGSGSTFTLYLPHIYTTLRYRLEGPDRVPQRHYLEGMRTGARRRPSPLDRRSEDATLLLRDEVGDDRIEIERNDQVLLIVDDDVRFARILLDRAREQGFKGIVTTGGAAVLPLVRQSAPCAVTLDIELPDADGWTILDRLKHDPDTRHIPVQISRSMKIASGA